MSALAKSYWRSIQRGTRAFGAIPDRMKEPVRALARADLEAGALDAEAYRALTGDEPGEAA